MRSAGPPLRRLHVVTNDTVLSRRGFLDDARRLLTEAAPGCLHVRGPRTDGAILDRIAKGLREAARRQGWSLVVNDRVDVALTLGLEGVHLGQRSIEAGAARTILGERALIGVSVHDVAEATDAARSTATGGRGVDYLMAGAIFFTDTHPGRPPLHARGLARIARAVDLPIIAVGGVTPVTVAECLAAGAYGVATVSGVWDAGDPVDAARAFQIALAGGQDASGREKP